MSTLLKIVGGLFGLVLVYFLLWPVPVSPVDWQAPVDAGYSGAFEVNTKLQDVPLIDLNGYQTPEDIAVDKAGWLYTGVHGGKVLKINPVTEDVEVFADTGGQALGLEFDQQGHLIVADAYKGLLSISPAGQVQVLADKAGDGSRLGYVDDLDITPDGVIWFSDASTKYFPDEWGGTRPASLPEIWEHAGTGRVMRYDPASGEISTVLKNLVFSNGIAADPAGKFILVNETGNYRVLKFWLEGSKKGTSEVLIDNLPGFPDNINRDIDGTYLLGLVAPRSPDIDKLSGNGFLRKVLWRIPNFAASIPPMPYSHLVRLDASGKVLETWQDPTGAYPEVTGAVRSPDGTIYVSSLQAEAIAVIEN